MAIHGPRLWNDRKLAYFTQENNAIEHLLSCRLPQGQSSLESCGPTAAVNCLASLEYILATYTIGGYRIQPEDLLTVYFNDPANFPTLKKAWAGLDPSTVAGNEVAQWYPAAVREVFIGKCDFLGEVSWEDAIAQLKKSRALQVCLSQPRHFIAIVAYDDIRDLMLMKDSWPSRWPDGDGFLKPFTKADWDKLVRPLSLAYYR